jgi:cell division septum initiation protein DivIVA
MASSSPQQPVDDDSDLDLSRHVIEPDRVSTTRDEGDVGTQFDLNWRGYDRHQVDAYLRTWGEDYWSTKNERDALLAELDHLRAQPPHQLSPLSSMSARLQGIVIAAEEEAEALRHESRAAADELLAAARAQADSDRAAAAAERSVAVGEADRMTREAREQYERIVGEAQAIADRELAEAHAEATRLLEGAQAEATALVSQATAEAAEIRRIVAAEEDQILSAARAEADELERSTTRQRAIAEAEHQRLLAAHASQQRHFSEGLRLEVAQLQAEAERLTTEVERRRTQVIAATGSPAPAPGVPFTPSRPAVAPPTVATTVLPPAADVDDTGEIAPLDSLLRAEDAPYDAGVVAADENTSIFDRLPLMRPGRPEGRSAIEALRRAGHGDALPDSLRDADLAPGLVDDTPTGETPTT